MNGKAWRVSHRGRDRIAYEERIGWRWRGIVIDGELLIGPAHHVIYCPSPQEWSKYPTWAQGRREEIIARIKSRLRAPDYEYQGDGEHPPIREGTAPAGPTAPRLRAATATDKPGQVKQGIRSLWLTILLLLVLSAGCGWLIARGFDTGSVTLPIRRAAHLRAVVRADEPTTWWLVIALYASISIGALAAALWLLRERWRLR